jgi:hypothetical protein
MSDNTNSDEAQNAEEMLKAAGERTRDGVGPVDTTTAETPELTQAAREAYERLSDGDLHNNVTVRDDDLAAFFAALDETDQLAEVGARATSELGSDETPETKTGVLAALARIGIEAVATDEWESRADGQREFLLESVD